MTDDPLAVWRLAPDLSVVNAAILIAGGDPARMDVAPDPYDDYAERTPSQPGYVAAFEALKAAILKGQLTARLAYGLGRGDDLDPLWPQPKCWIMSGRELGHLLNDAEDAKRLARFSALEIAREPDWSRSMMDVEDLRAWLRSRGVSTGFFFPLAEERADDFLDEAHDHFAPELALAVAAWQGLATRQTFHGGVRAVIEGWIDTHPEAWKGGGSPSANAKERVAIVANWKQKGGAPKTGV